MTAPARITQDDMTRAAKAVAAAGLERARIRMDLQNQTIDIIIGEPVKAQITEEWNDDD